VDAEWPNGAYDVETGPSAVTELLGAKAADVLDAVAGKTSAAAMMSGISNRRISPPSCEAGSWFARWTGAPSLGCRSLGGSSLPSLPIVPVEVKARFHIKPLASPTRCWPTAAALKVFAD
jgi:hypothetical protein